MLASTSVGAKNFAYGSDPGGCPRGSRVRRSTKCPRTSRLQVANRCRVSPHHRLVLVFLVAASGSCWRWFCLNKRGSDADGIRLSEGALAAAPGGSPGTFSGQTPTYSSVWTFTRGRCRSRSEAHPARGNALGESGNPGISSADLKFITSITLPALIRVAESAADAKNSSALLPALDREAERLIPLLEKGTKTMVASTARLEQEVLEQRGVVGRVTWGGGAAYLVFLMVAGRVASRRIAAPMAELVRISQGESTGGREAIQPASGPVEFQELSARLKELIHGLEQVVEERTRALRKQAGALQEEVFHRKAAKPLSLPNLNWKPRAIRVTQDALVKRERFIALGELRGTSMINNLLRS